MKRYVEDNGEIMAASEVLPEIERLNARIAELEAWHPASEPPEDVFDEVILFLEAYHCKRTYVKRMRYITTGSFVSAQESEHIIILGWKEMPLIPETERIDP